METIIIITGILSSYIFGLMSGVIMMKKKNRNSKMFYEELMTKQAKQLAKTRKNKVSDEAWQPKLTDKQVDVSKAPFSMPDAGYGWSASKKA
tara:strand:+ start:149 stop:424 length:276 start_codon:yes stop_codon:yes gene_type:complete